MDVHDKGLRGAGLRRGEPARAECRREPTIGNRSEQAPGLAATAQYDGCRCPGNEARCCRGGRGHEGRRAHANWLDRPAVLDHHDGVDKLGGKLRFVAG
jgi:hypothetical protein